ncbi:MAG: PIN domain-containing protein [Kiritimatiellae bacterium]|jgi:predicted nucleic acid-binding protein|nr:PIN domain-containing protein [Kiritimatiellia bacterium]
MPVLIDSSIWIDYFKDGKKSTKLDLLIDENQIVLNNLILAELIPVLAKNRESRLIDLLYSVERIPIQIDWHEIIELQTLCLKNGINKVGISDLIIVQNCIQNNVILYSIDKHFKLIQNITSLKML